MDWHVLVQTMKGVTHSPALMLVAVIAFLVAVCGAMMDKEKWSAWLIMTGGAIVFIVVFVVGYFSVS